MAAHKIFLPKEHITNTNYQFEIDSENLFLTHFRQVNIHFKNCLTKYFMLDFFGRSRTSSAFNFMEFLLFRYKKLHDTQEQIFCEMFRDGLSNVFQRVILMQGGIFPFFHFRVYI